MLEAICNLVENSIGELADTTRSLNKMNRQGESLEGFVKDAFAGTFSIEDAQHKLQAYQTLFSYLGNQNNPPDFMIRGGDAVEVKKLERKAPRLALNSSYPKAELRADSPMITKACRDAETWSRKDLLYVVGRLEGQDSVRTLWLSYGDCYAAASSVYERAREAIKIAIQQSGLELETTKELGRVNQIDPLGITNLRIRGMWEISSPETVFSHLLTPNPKGSPRLSAVMSKEKFSTMPTESLARLNSLEKMGITVKEVSLADPNNPANVKPAVLIDWIKL